MNVWPKQCATCGASISSDEWTSLFFVGLQEDDCGGHLELRNHHCGSTLAISHSAAELPEALRSELASVFRNDANALAQSPPVGIRPSEADKHRAEVARLRDIANALLIRKIEGEGEDEDDDGEEPTR
jgi:hypothetical protein